MFHPHHPLFATLQGIVRRTGHIASDIAINNLENKLLCPLSFSHPAAFIVLFSHLYLIYVFSGEDCDKLCIFFSFLSNQTRFAGHIRQYLCKIYCSPLDYFNIKLSSLSGITSTDEIE